MLRGNLGPLMQGLKEDMKSFSASMAFEKAQMTKRKLEALQNYQSKSGVVSHHLKDIDVASIVMGEEESFVNYMVVADGRVMQSKSLMVEKKLDESPEEILAFAISVLRSKFKSEATEIVVPFPVEIAEKDLKTTIPKAGEKKQLLDLSFKNGAYFQIEQQKKKRLLLKDRTADDRQEMLEQLQDDLQLSALPDHIECFDNSNFQGSFPVAAMVCFKNGLPSKKDYRHFHIKTVSGINDFASMAEIVKRRYKRLLDEGQALPQLVIIDGGKGQLSSALESIEALGLTGRMTVVGLAKREEQLFFPGGKMPLVLPYNGQSLLFLRRIRDEVHRFGITFHRETRSKGTIRNELEGIPGIGEKTAQTLLQTYRSVAKIKQMTQRELTLTLGATKAGIVFRYFHPPE
jgi:excinuclease ABC subunit C